MSSLEQVPREESIESPHSKDVETITSWLSWYIHGISDREQLLNILHRVQSALKDEARVAQFAEECRKEQFGE